MDMMTESVYKHLRNIKPNSSAMFDSVDTNTFTIRAVRGEKSTDWTVKVSSDTTGAVRARLIHSVSKEQHKEFRGTPDTVAYALSGAMHALSLGWEHKAAAHA